MISEVRNKQSSTCTQEQHIRETKETTPQLEANCVLTRSVTGKYQVYKVKNFEC